MDAATIGSGNGGHRGADRARPPARHLVRAHRDRAEGPPQPVLPGAPLHRVRHPEAAVAGRVPGDEGRRRLGCGLHRVRARQRRLGHFAVGLVALLGRRGFREPRPDVRCCAPPRRAGGNRAASRRGHGLPEGVEVADHRPLADRQCDVPRRRSAKGDGRRRHPARSGGLGGRGGACQGLRLRHRVRLRGPQLPAGAIPVPGAEPACRRLRRPPREPGSALARDARARARGGRLGLRDRGALCRRRATARGVCPSRRASSSSRWPIPSSTCGTSPSAGWRGLRGSTRRRPVSSAKATS